MSKDRTAPAQAYLRLRRISAIQAVAAAVGFLAGCVSAIVSVRSDPGVTRTTVVALAFIPLAVGVATSIFARQVTRRFAESLVAVLERVGIPTRTDPLTVHWRLSQRAVTVRALASVAVFACLFGVTRLVLGPHHPTATLVFGVFAALASANSIHSAIRDVALRRRTGGRCLDLNPAGISFPTGPPIAWTQVTNVYPAAGRLGRCMITFELRTPGGIVKRSIDINDVREPPEDVMRIARSYLASLHDHAVRPA